MAAFIPERQGCTAQAFTKGDAPGFGEGVRVAKDLGKTVEWDSARQVMNVVDADIPGDPAHYAGQCIVLTALQCCFVNVPILVALPAGFLELVLNIAEPHASHRGEKHRWKKHEQQDMPTTEPDERCQDSGDSCICRERAQPITPA